MIEPADSTRAVYLQCDCARGERVPVAAAAPSLRCGEVLLSLLLLDLDEFDRRRENSAGERENVAFSFGVWFGRGGLTYVEARPQPAPARKIWPRVGSGSRSLGRAALSS